MIRAVGAFFAVTVGMVFVLAEAMHTLFGERAAWPLSPSLQLGFALLCGAIAAGLLLWYLEGPPAWASTGRAGSEPDVAGPAEMPDRLTRIARRSAAEDAKVARDRLAAPAVEPPLPAYLPEVSPVPMPPRAPLPPASPLRFDPARQAIVLRQHFPPRHDTGLSFFGGAPVAPAGAAWPTTPDGEGEHPLTFIMQIDCAAVRAAGRSGLLPDHGVLYFFLDLHWSGRACFAVIHADAHDGPWEAIPVPDDLMPVYGDQSRYVWKWLAPESTMPRLLPRWSFDPVLLELPAEAWDPEDYDAEDEAVPVLWPQGLLVEQALLDAQGEDIVSEPFSMREFLGEDGLLRRPFDAFPHDWRAMQIVAGLLCRRLQDELRALHARNFPDTLAPEERAERIRQRDEQVAAQERVAQAAQDWYAHATARAPFDAVPEFERARFWDWLAEITQIACFVLKQALTLSIEASLTESAEAAARVPRAIAARLRLEHALAGRYDDGKIFAVTPDRLLAPPSDVQGHQYERAQTHLLLFEMSSNEGLGHHFGEGVYQFWITPEDLRDQRFDRVELTTDAY